MLGASLVLQECGRSLREQRDGGPRIGSPARLFFKPLEPFMVDDAADHKHPGRVARVAMEPLWTWVRRDLLPDETTSPDRCGQRRPARRRRGKSEHLTRAFQDRAAAAIKAAFAAADDDEKIRRRMLVQIGTPRAYDDGTVLMRVLKSRDTLATFAAHLPLQIANLADTRLDQARVLIESTAAFDGDTFLHALLTVMGRLGAPWQLIRLGIKAAGTDAAARVADTPYGVTVNIVLAELERLVGELRGDLRSGKVWRSARCSRRFTTRRGACAPNWNCQSTAPGAALLAAQRDAYFRSAQMRNRIHAGPGAASVSGAASKRDPLAFRARCR